MIKSDTVDIWGENYEKEMVIYGIDNLHPLFCGMQQSDGTSKACEVR